MLGACCWAEGRPERIHRGSGPGRPRQFTLGLGTRAASLAMKSTGSNLIDNPASRWREGLMTQHYGLQEPLVQRAWYRGDYKLIVHQDGFCELYNLAHDPGELNNLALNPLHETELQSMQRELITAMRAVSDDDERIVPILEVALA